MKRKYSQSFDNQWSGKALSSGGQKPPLNFISKVVSPSSLSTGVDAIQADSSTSAPSIFIPVVGVVDNSKMPSGELDAEFNSPPLKKPRTPRSYLVV